MRIVGNERESESFHALPLVVTQISKNCFCVRKDLKQSCCLRLSSTISAPRVEYSPIPDYQELQQLADLLTHSTQSLLHHCRYRDPGMVHPIP